VKLYRMFFEGRGWSPDVLNALTPKQLEGIAGAKEGGNAAGKTFTSTNDAIAEYQARASKKGERTHA
jgi:hypothetical protein